MRHLPEEFQTEFGTALRQIEHLSRIEQPLKLLQQLGALIAATLRIDEHKHGRHIGRGNGLDHECALFLVLGLLRLGRRLLLRRLAQRRLEAALARQLHDPRGRHYDA